MLKIALLHYSAPPIVGGVEHVIGHHAHLMANAGHKVCIVAARGTATNTQIEFRHLPLADSLHPEILHTKAQLDTGQVPSDFNQLINTIFTSLQKALTGCDLVIAHNIGSLHKNLALTAALRQFCAQPDAPGLILWHHDLAWTMPRYQQELHPGWPWQIIREDWPEVRPRHVVISELRRQELAQLTGLAPTVISVIPSGLDVSAFLKLAPQTADLVQQLDLLSAAPLFLLPVRITERKNIELAIRTVMAMRQTFPEATLVVTGPPDPHDPASQTYFDRLKQLRNESCSTSSGPKIHFLAEMVSECLPDAVIADFYQLADAMLLPSYAEGFGIPMLEAALAGKPVFCTDIPSLREIAGEKATYFSPDIHPDQLAQSIVKQLSADSVYCLRQHIRQNYLWDNIYTNRIRPLLQMPHTH
ncbi:MAG: glycosyltransferase family 4 protein [Pseudomonadota bacterium]